MKIIVMRGTSAWYWKVIARNGRVLAVSETYSTLQKALKTGKIVGAAFDLPVFQVIGTKKLRVN